MSTTRSTVEGECQVGTDVCETRLVFEDIGRRIWLDKQCKGRETEGCLKLDEISSV